MTDQTLIDALRRGSNADTFLLLAREADDVWMAHTPDDTATIGIARVGSTNIGISPEGLVFHTHSDPQAARACSLGNRDLAALQGWTLVQDPELAVASAEVPPGAEPYRVPDVVAEVNGRPAEIFYV